MNDITRRRLIGAIAAAGVYQSGLGRVAAQTAPLNRAPHFGFADVIRRAQELAHAPFDATPQQFPDGISKLDYDAWRDIRFKPERALLVGASGAFRLETFHPGFLFNRAVTVNTIRDGIATPVPYSTALFDYGRVKIEKPLPINTGFAGFRLHFPVNDPHVFDEVISFLGASYFRFLGRGQKYGLSARALCVEAGMNNESFPFFREFWVDAPPNGGNHVTIYALLDGEATTGAFRFDLTPGQESVLDVEATLFPRRAGVKFGLAPLTSMYLRGENDHRIHDKFRYELHDSDGLLIHTGTGEWIWRPLGNPSRERISSFMGSNMRGFGLLQRDRAFETYQDLDLSYEMRPNYFVEPLGSWQDGRVELIELPTSDETNDNIVASWTPAAPLEQGKPFSYSYRITASMELARLSPNGRVANTFETSARALGSSELVEPGAHRFLVDFAGGDLAYYVADPSQVEVVVSTTNGRVVRASVAANPHIEGVRAQFDVAIKPGQTADLRAFLRAGERALTETWTYVWTEPTAS